MDATALSITARRVRSHLASSLALTEAQIKIGPPSTTAREQEGDASNAQDVVNLFFYRVEYDGHPADGSNLDPFYVRAFCLITAFSLAETGNNGLGAGEKDLRAIGGVLACLHREPFITVRDEAGRTHATLQTVPAPLSLDDINHLWATQGELPYRLSVAYEFALLPVPLGTGVERAPKVGSLGLGVGDSVQRLPFAPRPPLVDLENPEWAPELRLVKADNTLSYALAFEAGHRPTSVSVIGIGAAGSSVELVWDSWQSAVGWRRLTTPPASLVLSGPALPVEPPPPTSVNAVSVPNDGIGQLQLTALRTINRPDGSTIRVSSNPLLVSIHRELPS